MLVGVSVNSGIATAKIFKKKIDTIKIEMRQVDNIQRELSRIDEARDAVEKILIQYRQKALDILGEEEAAVYKTHIGTIKGSILVGQVKKDIQEKHNNAEYILNLVKQKYEKMYAKVNDPFLKKKSDSIKYVIECLIRKLLGMELGDLQKVPDGVILVADSITKNDYLNIKDSNLSGIVLESLSKSNYARMLGSELSIPVIIGAKDIMSEANDGDELTIDAFKGMVIINPSKEQKESYEEIENIEQSKEVVSAQDIVNTQTKDGKSIALSFCLDDMEKAEDISHYESVGIVKTEFSYVGKKHKPDVNDLEYSYKQIVKNGNGIPITFRVLDVTSHDDLPYFYSAKEKNPELGLRGTRLLFFEREAFTEQLNAILKSADNNKVRIAFPNVVSYNELLEIKMLIEEVKRKDKSLHAVNVEIGLIIDTPASGLLVKVLGQEVDFIMIDSTKLIQLLKAVDKDNETVNELYDIYCPSVLSFMKDVIEKAHELKKDVSMIGDMTRYSRFLPMLVGLGVDEIVLGEDVNRAKWIVSKTSVSHWKEVISKCIRTKSSYEVNAILFDEISKFNG